MQYNLKDKIKITEEFLNDLITRSWQESDAIQQQVANIDTSTKLGADVAGLLKNMCTNYYILIGCLETLAEGADLEIVNNAVDFSTRQDIAIAEPEVFEAHTEPTAELPKPPALSAEDSNSFEPFEYFIDFDEPSGEPLSDEDLYGN